MNPTLYDILGVSPDASREEIRKAWREAADRFEPGEGGSTKQFRLFNEAAEVLLDPERRKAYDAEFVKDEPPAEEPAQGEAAQKKATAEGVSLEKPSAAAAGSGKTAAAAPGKTACGGTREDPCRGTGEDPATRRGQAESHPRRTDPGRRGRGRRTGRDGCRGRTLAGDGGHPAG